MQPFMKNVSVEYAEKAAPGGEIDTAIKEKTTIEAVTELVEGGTLDGNFNSVITPSLNTDASQISAQKPVVEVMTGYSFVQGTQVPTSGIELVYCGVCKNGNKLTMVVAGKFSPTASISVPTNINLGYFIVPQAVGELIVPMNDGIIGSKEVSLIANYADILNKNSYITKNLASPRRINFEILRLVDGYTNDRVYTFRIEETFLLSENLVA